MWEPTAAGAVFVLGMMCLFRPFFMCLLIRDERTNDDGHADVVDGSIMLAVRIVAKY